MSIFNKDFDLLNWGLRIGFILFIFCIVAPAFLVHAFKTLKEIPREPWPLALMALIGGVAGAVLRDTAKMIKARLRKDSKEVE